MVLIGLAVSLMAIVLAKLEAQAIVVVVNMDVKAKANGKEVISLEDVIDFKEDNYIGVVEENEKLIIKIESFY